MKYYRYSFAEREALVVEYSGLPRGMKRSWLAEKGIPPRTFDDWRHQVAAGTLEFGLTPRKDASTQVKFRGWALAMDAKDKKIAELEQKIEKLKAKHEFELTRERRTADLLGKAIETLEKSSGES